ncbi:hypothetical protein H0H93_010060 [Arthromyces matolae]|nr:hypothetical protein H0H93_010060 [Arthromyces matolae]
MLWTFNILPEKTADSKTGKAFQYDDSDAAFDGSFSCPPFKFPAVFEPRSLQRAEIARREWVECEKDLNILLPAPKDK